MNNGHLCRVTCLKCKLSANIRFFEDQHKVQYIDHLPIIASRFRPDLRWGFECQCGNDSRLAKEEIPQVNVLVQNASKSVIDRIVQSAQYKPELKFKVESA